MSGIELSWQEVLELKTALDDLFEQLRYDGIQSAIGDSVWNLLTMKIRLELEWKAEFNE